MAEWPFCNEGPSSPSVKKKKKKKKVRWRTSVHPSGERKEVFGLEPKKAEGRKRRRKKESKVPLSFEVEKH
jgi:hypothetical protein